MLHNADKRYDLPIIAHIDLNAKLSNTEKISKIHHRIPKTIYEQNTRTKNLNIDRRTVRNQITTEPLNTRT